MNKEEARQKINSFKCEIEKLEQIIKDYGFDWDFIDQEYLVESNGLIHDKNSVNRLTFCFPQASRFNDIETAMQMAKIHVFNSLLMQLAAYCNPNGWWPDWSSNRIKHKIYFNYTHKKLDIYSMTYIHSLTPTFNSYESAQKAIDILNASKERWWHLVFDGEPK